MIRWLVSSASSSPDFGLLCWPTPATLITRISYVQIQMHIVRRLLVWQRFLTNHRYVLHPMCVWSSYALLFCFLLLRHTCQSDPNDWCAWSNMTNVSLPSLASKLASRLVRQCYVTSGVFSCAQSLAVIGICGFCNVRFWAACETSFWRIVWVSEQEDKNFSPISRPGDLRLPCIFWTWYRLTDLEAFPFFSQREIGRLRRILVDPNPPTSPTLSWPLHAMYTLRKCEACVCIV